MARFLKAAVALASVMLASAGESINLTEQNIVEVVRANPALLVKFYTPWCGHCKALAPAWEEAASQLPEGALAEVDCTIEEKVCQQFKVEGYPTILFFNNYMPQKYQGGREAKDIVNFMSKHVVPAFTEVKTSEELKAIVDAQKNTVFAVFATSDEQIEIVKKVAAPIRQMVTFVIVKDAAVAQAAGIKVAKSYNAVDGENTFEGELTEEALHQFALAEGLPLMGSMGPDNYRMYFEKGQPLIILFIDPSNEEQVALSKSLKPLAAEHKGKYTFADIDGAKFVSHAHNLGLTGNLPEFLIQEAGSPNKFIHAGEVTYESVKQYVSEHAAGKLKPSIKSQPVPAEQKGPVYELVGSTFDEVVIKSDKDVLVEFYAPWCGHCKELAPTYEELAKDFASDSNVVIAKIDATENDVADTPIEGYPTLILYVNGQKDNGIMYDGPPTKEALAAFIKSKGKIETEAAEAGEAAESHEL